MFILCGLNFTLPYIKIATPDFILFTFAGLGFSGGSDSKESTCNAGDLSSILGQEDPLEKGKATQSSILAWEIPWTEEPGGLQSMGLQRVGYD